MLTNCYPARTHLSSTVSQLFEPQVQKIASFTYRSPHVCFPWRRPCDYHAICCMDGKTIQCLPNPSQHVFIFNSFRVIRCLNQCVSPKIAIFTTFCFPWRHPWGNHAKCCMDRKKFRCLQNVSQHVPTIFNSFPVIRTASAKNRHFHVTQPTFLFPLETPLEREFGACQTPRSMFLSIFNSFRVIRCLSQYVSPKIAIFSTFLFPLGTPLGQSR